MIWKGRSANQSIAVAIGIAAVAFVAYWPALHGRFTTYDDPIYVVDNGHVTPGVTARGVMWAFTTGHAANWHPLTWISHMLDAQVWGLDAFGHHLTNIVLHAASSVLLFAVLFRATRETWASAMTAALFALHPAHVESVAWVAERKDVLSTVFLMLTLLAYLRYVERRGAASYALVVVVYGLGLMAKPMLVTLPFALLLIDYWPLRRLEANTLRNRATEKLPLLALAAAASIVTFAVQRSGGAVVSTSHLPVAVRVSNALVGYLRYLGKLAWPTDLGVFYPHPGAAQPLLAAISIAFLAVLTWTAWRARIRRPYLIVGWLWFIGTLVPVIGLVQVGSQAIADRYTYIPSIGVFLALAWLLRDACDPRFGFASIAAAPVLIALTLLTRVQCGYWRNTRTLFEHTLAITTDNALANQCLGNALLIDGEIDAAIPHLEEAIRLAPDFPDAHNNLGTALGSKGRIEEAIQHFRLALAQVPDAPETHFNLAFALGNNGRFDEAIPEYEEALRLDPVSFKAHSKLAMALAIENRYDEALSHVERALEIRPDDVDSRRELAVLLTRSGDIEGAIVAYRRLLQDNPRDLDALNNIAWIRATHEQREHRDPAEAVRLAERARDLATEDNAILFDTLAAAYASAGRFDDAVKACERAQSLTGSNSPDGLRFREHEARFRSGKALFD